jgi:hypothetical protein
MSIFTSADLSRTELQRRTAVGDLRLIARGIYSDDAGNSPEEIVAREWRTIVGKVMPGAVVSYANAFTCLPAGGEVNVSHRRRDPLVLPGLTVRSDMVGRRDADDISLGNGLFMASQVRGLIDNSADHPGRPNRRIAKLTREQLHDHIVKLTQTTAPPLINALVQDVKQRAPRAVGDGIAAFFAAARAEINTVDTPSRLLRAAQTGEGYDQDRVALFHEFAISLNSKGLVDRPDTIPSFTSEIPFFEAYFSNFIEGTEFTLDETESIIYEQADLGRPEDAHDILGTFEVTSSPTMRVMPRDADEFLEALRSRHATMMRAHPNRLPGFWKDRSNRAGLTEFVSPALVPGTLRAGWEEGEALDDPFRRAVYLMFLVSEVHPFIDGNGRSSRVMMNNALTARGQHRAIIPTILRLSYLNSLTRATNGGGADGLFRVLDHAQHWVATGDWSTRQTGREYAEATNALTDAHTAERERLYLEVGTFTAIPPE